MAGSCAPGTAPAAAASCPAARASLTMLPVRRRSRRRQAVRRRQHGRLRHERAARRVRTGAPSSPAGEARAQEPDAIDVGAECAHAFTPARPKTRLQLEPPKPKELLMTRCSGSLRFGQQVVHRQRRIDFAGVDAGGHEVLAQREGADHRFQRAGRAERVPGRALGGAARYLAPEHRGDRARFGRVVARRGGAVEVDVVDPRCVQARRGRAPAASPRARRARPGAARTCGARRSIHRSPAAAPHRRRGSSPARSSSANAAASPIDRPLRATSKGRQGSSRHSCSE